MIHSLGPGGAEQLLVEFAAAAPEVGLRTTVVSLTGIVDSTYSARLERAGAEVLSAGLRTRWDVRAFGRVHTLLERVGPDVIQTHLKHADTVGSVVAWRLGVPMVSTLHRIETGGTAMERVKRRAGGRARLAVAARTIAVSDAQRRWYLDAFDADPRRVVTVHNGIGVREPVEDSVRATVRRELGVEDGDVVAAMLGVMRPGKGHADLLRAARLLPRSVPLRLVLAGKGELAPAISRAVEGDPVLRERVILPGWCDDVDRLLGGCDVLVHPTHDDAFPTAVIHGLAAGLPVVASDVGGVPELVDDATGKLVPPGQAPALAAALTDLAQDPARRAAMGRAARAKFDREFTASAWVRRLHGLYREVLAE